jgi:molecular chaperone IbpA
MKQNFVPNALSYKPGNSYFSYATKSPVHPSPNELMRELVDDLFGPSDSFPHYDITYIGNDTYDIQVAVAGFSEDMIDVSIEESRIIIKGTKPKVEDEEKDGEKEPQVIIHRGIAKRSFIRRLDMGMSMTVVEDSCFLERGILHLQVQKYVPDYKKKRSVTITRV